MIIVYILHWKFATSMFGTLVWIGTAQKGCSLIKNFCNVNVNDFAVMELTGIIRV